MVPPALRLLVKHVLSEAVFNIRKGPGFGKAGRYPGTSGGKIQLASSIINGAKKNTFPFTLWRTLSQVENQKNPEDQQCLKSPFKWWRKKNLVIWLKILFSASC
jgi:hypothetical protein